VHRFVISRIFLILIMFTGIVFGQGIRLEQPKIEGFHPLDEETDVASPLAEKNPVILELNTTIFKDTAVVGFEKRQITFRRYDELGYTMWEYHYGELNEYLASIRNYSVSRNWQKHLSDIGKGEASVKKQDFKLKWELPVQYPSWAQRILGNEPPRLSINGRLTITVGYDHSTIKRSDNDENPGRNHGMDFNLDYQYSITGSVGKLININISGNSEDEFQMDNNLKNFKIEYKESKPGELEDEIIQEVIAGWTGFSMPGTNLSGYSESHEGLFGVKVKSKLGPLTLTTIASTEQGESQKLTIGTGEGGESSFYEDDFVLYKYFFLDTIYRRAYNRKYAPNASQKVTPPPKIDRLSIWKGISNQAEVAELQKDSRTTIKSAIIDSSGQTYLFQQLTESNHYFVNKDEGWIRFVDSVSIRQTDRIAIQLRTEDGSIVKGDIATGDTIVNLWLLKDNIPIDSIGENPERDHLMWRNVYRFSNERIESFASFKIEVKRKKEGETDEQDYHKDKLTYAQILGISDGNTPLISRSDIFDKENSVMIIPPYDTTFFGNEPFRNPALEDYRDTTIYTYGKSRIRNRDENYKPIFAIYTSGTQKQTEFSLGWGVMKGTEIVRAGGRVLERDKDYDINYDMGELYLKSPPALAADKITIEYQRDALFVPDKKTFLGMHGELRLPGISDKSFIGASVLFQNTRILDDIPRLGQEPYNKWLFDINSRIELEPEWMTSLVNRIPLVHTDNPSSVVFDFEVASSYMNPNTHNEAFVDDFEESKIPYTLPTNHEEWSKASPPDSLSDSLVNYPQAWDFYWFQPVEEDKTHMVRKTNVWVNDNEKRQAGEIDYQYMLRLHCTPAPDFAPERYKNTWAGIMYPLSSSFADKTKERYFEFLFKDLSERGLEGKGKLLIQFGEMREDVSLDGGPPNGMENREDTSAIWTDRIDSKLDLGWDRLHDTLEYYLVPNIDGTGWDTLKYGDPRLGPDSLDPAKDNYKDYDRDLLQNYRYACRTQGDNRLTGEDINYDGVVQTRIKERYFQYEIDLGDTDLHDAILDKDARLVPGSGWKKFRIPLKEVIPGYEHIRTEKNNPSWTRITMVRIIWTGFDPQNLTREHQLALAEMQFVGNQWSAQDSVVSKIEATSINNDEDAYYRSQLDRNLIRIKKDAIGNYERESALRLNFNDIKAGDTALVSRPFYQQFNFTPYKELSLLLFGNENVSRGSILYDGDVDFVFRFGSNDSIYYEYRQQIHAGWQQIRLDLRKIARFKDDWMIQHPDSAIITDVDSSGNGVVKVRAPRGMQPDLSKVTWAALGVIRKGDSFTPNLVSGEIWVNEMKLAGIGKMKGVATRVDLKTGFSDLLNMSAGVNYEDGDFMRMTENDIRAEESRLSGQLSANLALNKFLPDDWNVSLPVGASVNSSLTRPQLKNGDVLLHENGHPDGFFDMISDAAKMVTGSESNKDKTSAEHYETQNVTTTAYANFKKGGYSKNPLVNLTADRISTGINYSSSVNKQAKGPAPDSDSDFVIIDTVDTYKGELKYNLNPVNPPEWTKWRPFGNVESEWFPADLKSYEFSLLPTVMEFDLADANFRRHAHYENERNIADVTKGFDMSHGMRFNYSPISPLISFEYSLRVNRDLKDIASGNFKEKADHVFSFHDQSKWKEYGILWGEKGRTQQTSVNFSPQLFGWLSTTANYSSNYQEDMVTWSKDTVEYLSAGVMTTLSLNSTLDFNQLFQGMSSLFGDSSFAAGIGKGFNNIGLRSINFSYSVSSDLKNNYLSEQFLGEKNINRREILTYQLGLKGKRGTGIWDLITGDMDEYQLGGMKYRLGDDKYDFYKDDKRIVDRRWSVSTGLNLSKPFPLTFNTISLGWDKRHELQPDTLFYDTLTVFPELSLGASTSAFANLTGIKELVRNLNVNSNFTLRFQEGNSSSYNVTKGSRIDWAPMIGLDGTLRKWPVNFDARHGQSKEVNGSYDKNGSLISQTIIKRHGQDINFSYSLESNSRLAEIRLFSWVIPVRGRTTIGARFTNEVREETVEKKDQQGEMKEDDPLTEWTIHFSPHIEYVFTDNVKGRAEYAIGKVKRDEEVNKTNRFALIAEIFF